MPCFIICFTIISIHRQRLYFLFSNTPDQAIDRKIKSQIVFSLPQLALFK